MDCRRCVDLRINRGDLQLYCKLCMAHSKDLYIFGGTHYLKKMMYPNSVACETVIQRSMGTADRLLYCNELFGMLCEDEEMITNFRAGKEVESLCSL